MRSISSIDTVGCVWWITQVLCDGHLALEPCLATANIHCTFVHVQTQYCWHW
jgi:hypothetical protein